MSYNNGEQCYFPNIPKAFMYFNLINKKRKKTLK